jgi:hypothetical protein
MLDTASTLGVTTIRSPISLERIDALKTALPEARVSELTERSNAVCFGKLLTNEAALEAIRQSMQAAPRK